MRILVALTALLAGASAVSVASTVPDDRLAGPVEAYLMADRKAEIALARTAARPSVSAEADIYVLTSDGYELAEAGGNGFVCLVLRSFTAPFSVPNFWEPAVRGPVCYNPAAAVTALEADRLRTRLALAGVDRRTMRTEIHSDLGSAYLFRRF